MMTEITDKHTIRPLRADDLEAMLALLPQLADFNVPERRNPDHLWLGDAELLQKVAANSAPDSFAEVLVDQADQPIGLLLVTMREELLSHAPSAHLEALVVSPQARGRGFGQALLSHAEQSAKQRGAASLTLHVFSNNLRARGLYDKQGYDSELIRAIRWLD